MLGRKAVRLRLYPGWDFIAYKDFVILSWPQTLYVAKDDLELLIFLSLTPECWNSRSASPSSCWGPNLILEFLAVVYVFVFKIGSSM